jgi:hypothetical protein
MSFARAEEKEAKSVLGAGQSKNRSLIFAAALSASPVPCLSSMPDPEALFYLKACGQATPKKIPEDCLSL